MRVLGAVVALAAVAGARARSSKDWSQLNFDALEHEWEDGDDEAELITEDELLYRETERRREVGIEVSDEMDAATVRHQQSMAGPAMMFVELRPTKPDGSAFVEEDYKWLAGSWRELMFTGGLEVQVYNVEESKFLISLKKGWDGHQAKEFLLQQPEVAKVTWDSHEYALEPDRPTKRRKKVKARKGVGGGKASGKKRTKGGGTATGEKKTKGGGVQKELQTPAREGGEVSG